MFKNPILAQDNHAKINDMCATSVTMPTSLVPVSTGPIQRYTNGTLTLDRTPMSLKDLIAIIKAIPQNRKVTTLVIPFRSEPAGIMVDSNEYGDLFKAIKAKGITTVTIGKTSKTTEAWRETFPRPSI